MLNLSPVAAVPRGHCYGDEEMWRAGGVLEKYHNTEAVQLKEKEGTKPFCHPSSLHSSFSHLTFPTKGYTREKHNPGTLRN